MHPPRKDTSETCYVFKTQIDAVTNTNEKKRELELMQEIAVCTSLNCERIKDEEGHEAFAFNLQKVMSLPRLLTNEAYYCCQLSA